MKESINGQLHLAHRKKVAVTSDCMKAMNHVLRLCNDNYLFKGIVVDVGLILHRDWQVRITHVHKEIVCVADHLAKYRIDDNLCLFDQLPPFLLKAGVDDG